MTILTGDIKLLASKVMDDVPEGGGGPTGTVIPDGANNAIFGDVTEVARAGGAVHIRQLHLAVQTASTDRFMDANIIVAQPPNDANVSVTLAACAPFARRTDIANAIENYLIQGPEWGGYLLENHVAGQRSIQLLQRPGAPTPPIGRTLVLVYLEGQSGEVRQYVRVTHVEVDDRTFTYLQSGNFVDYTASVVTCDLSDALRTAFPGSAPNRTFTRESNKTVVRDTTVADAATYYGAVPLSAVAALGDQSVRVASVYSQIVPSARTETAALDQKPAAQRSLVLATAPRHVEVGVTPHSLRIRVGQENRGFVWVQMLKPRPSPGTIVISYMALGNWYTVTDDGAGNLVGSGTGTVNYTTGSIALTLPSMPDAGSSIIFQWGENTAFTNRSGAAGYRMPEFAWLLPTAPVKPGSVTVSWPSGGVTRTVTDNGTGGLSGHGAGEINYATGQISLRPAYMLDAGGEFSTAYTYTTQVTEHFPTVAPDAGGFATLTLGEVPAPNSIKVQWTTVRNISSSGGSTEAVTNSTTTAGVGPDGKTVYSGGRLSNAITLYSPTSASTSGFPPGATVQARVTTLTPGTYNWQIQDVKTAPWPTAAMPADLVAGASSGSVVCSLPDGVISGLAVGTIELTLAAAAQMHEGTLILKTAGGDTVAFTALRVEPDDDLRAIAAPPTPADVARTATGVVAGPKSFPGGYYVADDGSVSGVSVSVQVDPLYDATYGYSYDPPMGQNMWNDAEFLTAKQKTMLSQRGVSRVYRMWGV